MIRELIEEIIEKYYRESDEYYSRYREDEDGNDFEMDELVKQYYEENGGKIYAFMQSKNKIKRPFRERIKEWVKQLNLTLK